MFNSSRLQEAERLNCAQGMYNTDLHFSGDDDSTSIFRASVDHLAHLVEKQYQKVGEKAKASQFLRSIRASKPTTAGGVELGDALCSWASIWDVVMKADSERMEVALKACLSVYLTRLAQRVKHVKKNTSRRK